jgi:hypothetical protein
MTLLQGQAEETKKEDGSTSSISANPKEEKKALEPVIKTEKSKKNEKAAKSNPCKKIFFFNARVNDIALVITNTKNQQVLIPIKMGCQHTYYYNIPMTKIICHEKSSPKTTLTKSDLETYTSFVFNDNQKTDKYHHNSIHEKNKALQRARVSGDISLFNDICEETIYIL